MRNFVKIMQVFHNEELAQDAVEYSLLALIVALGAIVGMGSLAASINHVMTQVASALT